MDEKILGGKLNRALGEGKGSVSTWSSCFFRVCVRLACGLVGWEVAVKGRALSQGKISVGATHLFFFLERLD
jgi:hypothetical protein